MLSPKMLAEKYTSSYFSSMLKKLGASYSLKGYGHGL